MNTNPDLQSSLEDNYIQLLTTAGHCDCDTMLGPGSVDAEQKEDRAREIARLRRKKWSPAKIERALADRQKAAENKPDKASDSLEDWENIILSCLDAGPRKVGLFYKMYSGLIETETIQAKTENINRTDFTSDHLKYLAEETLFFVTG